MGVLTIKMIWPRSPIGLRYIRSYWSHRWGITIWEPIRPKTNPNNISNEWNGNGRLVSEWGSFWLLRWTACGLTESVDDISPKESSGSKHCCSYSTGGRAASFSSRHHGMMDLPVLNSHRTSRQQHWRTGAWWTEEINHVKTNICLIK